MKCLEVRKPWRHKQVLLQRKHIKYCPNSLFKRLFINMCSGFLKACVVSFEIDFLRFKCSYSLCLRNGFLYKVMINYLMGEDPARPLRRDSNVAVSALIDSLAEVFELTNIDPCRDFRGPSLVTREGNVHKNIPSKYQWYSPWDSISCLKKSSMCF